MHITDIIKYPILTEKSYQQMQDNIYTFAVDRKATKFDIKRAVEFIFQVKVESVNTFNVPRKPKRVGKYSGFVAGYKKAIIKLAEGSKIQILPEEGIAADEQLKENVEEQKAVKAKVKEISEAEKKAEEKIKKATQEKTKETELLKEDKKEEEVKE